MAKATPQYLRLIQALPEVVVCTPSQLRQLVKILCREMHEGFTRGGICIPPWRSKDSLLSKWKLPASAYPCRDRVQLHPYPAQSACLQINTPLSGMSAQQQRMTSVNSLQVDQAFSCSFSVDQNKVVSRMCHEGESQSCESSA